MVDRFDFEVLGTETHSTYPEQLGSLSVMLNIVSTSLHPFVFDRYCFSSVRWGKIHLSSI